MTSYKENPVATGELDSYRSTKGASKQRRECINHEIDMLRRLLPLPENVWKRLSQLQVMALSKTYIQLANALGNKLDEVLSLENNLDSDSTLQALPGFLVILSTNGEILYISDNSSEHIGHSMVDIVSQSESIFDHIHENDQARLKALFQPSNVNVRDHKSSVTFRMGLMKHIKRNNSFDRYKVIRMCGRFINTHTGCCVFAGLCTPQFDAVHSQQIVDTNVFITTHKADMSIINMDDIAEHYLGASKHELANQSLYQIIHPNDGLLVATKHRELLQGSGKDILVCGKVRLLTGHFGDLSVQMALKLVTDVNYGQIIICYHQLIDSNTISVDPQMGGQMGLIEPKIEVDSDGKLDRADILRRLKNKMDKKSVKRKALTIDPPSYNSSIASKLIKQQNYETPLEYMLPLETQVMYGSPACSVTSDYHAVGSASAPEMEDFIIDDVSYPLEGVKWPMPELDQFEIAEMFQSMERKPDLNEISNFKFTDINDELMNATWLLNSNFESFNQSNPFLANLVF